MFGTLGGPELLLILVIALIVFGPRKLPEIGKSLGRMMGEFRRASNDFKRTIEEEVEADKLRSSLDVSSYDSPSPSPYSTVSAPSPEPATDVAPPYADAEVSGTDAIASPSVGGEAAPDAPAAAETTPDMAAVAAPTGEPPATSQG
jgi:TatA/E family protein of Tat protein translocase